MKNSENAKNHAEKHVFFVSKHTKDAIKNAKKHVL